MKSLYLFLLIYLLPNLRLAPIEGPISWLLYIPVSYFLIRGKDHFTLPCPSFRKYVFVASISLFILTLISFKIIYLKYLLVILFSTLLYSKSLLAFISFSLPNLRYCFRTYNIVLLLTLFLHFSYPQIFYTLSTSFMATYYGPILRFSGFNGEPGPNAFAIVVTYSTLLILLSLHSSPTDTTSSIAFRSSIFITAASLFMTFSLGAFIYIFISIGVSGLILSLLLFRSSYPCFLRASFFTIRTRYLTYLLVTSAITSSFFFFFRDSLSIFTQKLSGLFLALLTNNISEIPSRGDIFSNFLKSNSLYDFSTIFDTNYIQRTNVSAILNSIDQGSIILTLIVFLLPSLYFLSYLLSLFSKPKHFIYRQSYFIFLTTFVFFVCILSFFSLPEIHLYKFFIFLLFHSFVTSLDFSAHPIFNRPI